MTAGTILDVLALEQVEQDLFRAGFLHDDPNALYGGQVAAQALRAAGLTVGADRTPHSLHGYFLRKGDSERPTILRVDRDRDGRSFSARRVVAVQDGDVIFSMSVSFAVASAGSDQQVDVPPATPDPDGLPEYVFPRLFSMAGRRPPQPYEDTPWPTRFWSRCQVPLPADPLLHACVLTYLSDISSGLAGLDSRDSGPGPSLDHALWFHRPADAGNWLLTDLVPHTVAGGRGFYSGSFWQDGRLVASAMQETLFRRRPVPQA